MINPVFKKSGMALYMVLASLLIALILSGIILNIILSQARISYHQVSRVQAFYAAQAGCNYAIEKLRLGDDALCWPNTGAYTVSMVRTGGSGCDVLEPDLPPSVQQVQIDVDATGGANNPIRISTTATYTYNMP
ncbi:MAG: hypothetical protein ACM3IL_00730 [Deltaproteobacteria bacterium]